jgi:glyoxylase-like metal-dependent hydrolase (beta-lactamase superfamily II)
MPLKAAIVPVTPFQQNCTILWQEPGKRGVVIDPGGEVPRILEAVAKLEVRIERILLTHGHIDHAGGAAALQEALAQAAATGPGGAAPASAATVPIEGPDMRDRFLLEGLEAQAGMFGLSGVRNVLPDRWLVEGDTVLIGEEPFDVLHCPGHTPGHVLFAGSIGRTDFPYGDHAALIGAIKHKLLPLGDDFAFICGHGPGSTIGAERRSNPFVRG